ncbi:SAV_915 family protein [Kineosporia sp. NBRC 101731]|uniref:SAV_915 family protein n=1 Tax=Kineosporia sp. NBRC 101731 TaxID=3032199 RepID=UPI0024A591CE|nr:SAV_915 family protein [Kineosporia sp. NBRC 101731]GLY32508.1 hypothetical protein Kisp02_58730 [Kineosporia sp. NBRC 101731]
MSEPETGAAMGIADADDSFALEGLPPVLYVPRAPGPIDDEFVVDLRVMPDGRLGLPVYSALDRLVKHCGPDQPWAVMMTRDLHLIDEAQSFDSILLDLPIRPDMWRRVEEH